MTKIKLRNKLTGQKRTQEAKDNNSRAQTGKKLSVETRNKMSIAKKNTSEITRAKIRESIKKRGQKSVMCPHCNKEGKVMPMHRWHFDNCKLKN